MSANAAQREWKARMMRELGRSIKTQRRKGQRADLKRLATDMRLRRQSERAACEAEARAPLEAARPRLEAARAEASEAKRVCALADKKQRDADREDARKRTDARKAKRTACELPAVDRLADERARFDAQRERAQEAKGACGLADKGRRAKDRLRLSQRMQEHEATERSYKASELGERLRKKADAARPRQSAAERRAQEEEEVERDIERDDPELLAVWERVKGQIRATPRRSRAEAFFDWVHDNAGEVEAMKARIQEEEFERDFNEWSRRKAA